MTVAHLQPADDPRPGGGAGATASAAGGRTTTEIQEPRLGLAMLDADGTVVHANSVLLDLLGIPDGELTGLPFDMIDVSAPVPDAAVVMREHILTGPDGVQHRVRLTGVPWGEAMPTTISRVIAVEDVSARRKVQAELQTSQRLEAMGRLASGVAHEINTPIQFVGDNVTFLKEAVDSLLGVIDVLVDDLRDVTSNIARTTRVARVEALLVDADLDFYRHESPLAAAQAHDGVTRIATIVKAMRALGHPDPREMTPADLTQCLRDTVTLTRGSFKQVAALGLDLGELPPVMCLPGSVSQVITNLVVNAADAIRSNRVGQLPGHIRISSTADGEDVVITVSDDGGGIPVEIQDRLFEPFFTTKEVGMGTGQGLALARTVICDVHGGDLSFTTTPGEGTTFTVRLPIDGPLLGREPTTG